MRVFRCEYVVRVGVAATQLERVRRSKVNAVRGRAAAQRRFSVLEHVEQPVAQSLRALCRRVRVENALHPRHAHRLERGLIELVLGERRVLHVLLRDHEREARSVRVRASKVGPPQHFAPRSLRAVGVAGQRDQRCGDGAPRKISGKIAGADQRCGIEHGHVGHALGYKRVECRGVARTARGRAEASVRERGFSGLASAEHGDAEHEGETKKSRARGWRRFAVSSVHEI